MENECEHAKWDANSLKSSPCESRTLSPENECGFNAISIDSLVHSRSITYAKSLLIVLIEFYASKTTIINSWLYGIFGRLENIHNFTRVWNWGRSMTNIDTMTIWCRQRRAENVKKIRHDDTERANQLRMLRWVRRLAQRAIISISIRWCWT